MFGVPVLAHNLGGPSETIMHNKTGWLIPDMEVDTLKAQLSLIIENHQKLPSMGKLARKHALTHFTIQNEVDRWISQIGN